VTAFTPTPQTLHSATRVRPPQRAPRLVIAGGIVAAILGAAILGWLVWPKPPGAIVLHAGTSHYVITATLDSTRIGTTGINIDLTNRTGVPVDRATVEIEAIMPLMGHATPPLRAHWVGSGHYRATQVPVMMTGPWELQLSIDATNGVDYLTLPFSASG
jgi:YtkA-like